MKTLEFIVKDLPEGQLDIREVSVPPAEIDWDVQDVHFVGEIHGSFQLSRHVQGVYLKGIFSALIEVECRRCIEPFETGIEAEVEAQFYPTAELNPMDALLEDTGERYYSGSTIDLSDEVRQALVLELPMWSVCSESCEGLCLHCGENLNVAECGCYVTAKSSSPFAALAELLDPPDRAAKNGS